MEIMIIGAIFFAVALAVRRKEVFRFRWQPAQHTWIAVGAGATNISSTLTDVRTVVVIPRIMAAKKPHLISRAHIGIRIKPATVMIV